MIRPRSTPRHSLYSRCNPRRSPISLRVHAGNAANPFRSCVYFITRAHPGGGGLPSFSVNSVPSALKPTRSSRPTDPFDSLDRLVVYPGPRRAPIPKSLPVSDLCVLCVSVFSSPKLSPFKSGHPPSHLLPFVDALDAASSVSPLSATLTKNTRGGGTSQAPAKNSDRIPSVFHFQLLALSLVEGSTFNLPTFNRFSPISFRFRTYGKPARNLFRMNTSKTKNLKLFRTNTYKITRGRIRSKLTGSPYPIPIPLTPAAPPHIPLKWNLPISSARDNDLSTPSSDIKNTTAGDSRASRIWRALRHRNFRLFFTGQSISLIGTWMTRIATSWLVYKLTSSAWLLGVVGFAGQIPTFLVAPFAGVWVDRLDRRRVLVITQILAMVQSLALAVLTLSGRINDSRNHRAKRVSRFD